MGKPSPLALRRQRRVRLKLQGRTNARLRLSVFRSSRHVYAQVIDDAKGRTVVSASSQEADLRERYGHANTVDLSSEIGKRVAERALKSGVTTVVFDRGRYLYHGRVRALAEAAREAGLQM